MRFFHQIPAEYRSCSFWERVIGVFDENADGKMEAYFVPVAPIHPEPYGGANLILSLHREGLQTPLGQLYIAKHMIKQFLPMRFEMEDVLPEIAKGDVLTLTKENLNTKGMSMPDAFVQVVVWE